MLLKYFLLWFPMLLIAILNGTLRELVFRKFLDELTAHQASTVSLIILFSVYIALVLRWFPPATDGQAIAIGIFWLLLTLVFEFGFGRWRGHSWQTLLHDYNILQGRIWMLIPVWVGLAPYVLYLIRNR